MESTLYSFALSESTPESQQFEKLEWKQNGSKLLQEWEFFVREWNQNRSK